MYRIKSYKPDSHKVITQSAIAEKLRDNIWTIIDNWILYLSRKKGSYSWSQITKPQLIGDIPALLLGIAKVIEHPHNLMEFEPGGLMYKTATEFGINRRLLNYKSSELLFEQETIRNIVWSYCRKNLRALDVYELENRIGKSLDKMSFTVIESYIGEYANELTYLADHDKITGFLNYGSYKKALDTEIKRAKRYRHECSLILIEIDDINKYRELNGNVAVDNPIVRISTIIDQLTRSIDIPARYNRNTFAIILPETSADQASKVAERLRRTVKQESRHGYKRSAIKQPITISVGTSAYTHKDDIKSTDELEKIAKKSLADAKLFNSMSVHE